jgi:asparagine synthase (glutamine-hydrolysing)
MCGIAGIYSFKAKIENKWIKSMTDTLAHRGPDDEGFLAINTETKEINHLTGPDSKVAGQRVETFDKYINLLLGHRRLSIIDISPSGHQPMSNRDSTIWIVYNGEIYNYLELRKELETLGYDFKTNTDTEVLLAAYEQWQEKCLSRFNGMWSFVIYDTRENVFFGARDRFGVKPFYYYANRGYFAFASEIKALINLPFVKREINSEAVFDYLFVGMKEHEDEGFFKNIFELQPCFAFYYCLSTNTLRKWRYYSLDYADKWETFNKERMNDYVDKTRELLFDAVSLRLRSDVPVGTCLSGGIDSSAIVCFINLMLEKENIKQLGEAQKVFTASYDGQAIDESKWAKIVVDRTKTSWHRTFPKSNELIEDLEDLVYTQDIPFGSTSIYAQYRVMKLARENGIKVLLDGQGGDELFTGYEPYHGAFFLEMLKAFAIGDLVRELGSFENSPVDVKNVFLYLIKVLYRKLIPSSTRKFILMMRRKESNYLNVDFLNEKRDRLQIAMGEPTTSLNRMLHEFISELSLKSLLRYEDRNSMRFSIETRAPFSDDLDLIEYVFRIPSVYKIYSGWSKYLLRAATKGVLPEEIRLRKDKIGFATPEYDWLNEMKEEFRTYMTDDLKDFLDVVKIRRDWDTLVKKQTQTGITELWGFINFAVWKKVYAL